MNEHHAAVEFKTFQSANVPLRFSKMNNNLVKRTLILSAFGVVFAGVLLATDLIFSSRKQEVTASGPKTNQAAPPTRPQGNPAFSLPPAPAAVNAAAKPAGNQPLQASSPANESENDPGDLQKLFAAGQPASEVKIDPKQMDQLLRAHVARNHPSLKLSDREYERLAETIRIFREANLKMNSLERTSANAPAIRQSLQEMATAMQDFRQITGMTQGEFFSGPNAPVQFGGENSSSNENDKMVVDFLSDHKP
jgi:hypothetical protein